MSKTVSEIMVRSPEGDYPIFVGAGLVTRIGAVIGERGKFSTRCAIVTNSTVSALYAASVVASLRDADFNPTVIEIPDGEKFKTLETANAAYDRLIDAGLDRRSLILALGGGVVGDVAGFVAATFLRGVPFVQIPTTLLALVDSSIGGKVGVDHPRGKNLIGAFKPPLAVIADIDVLETLPDEEFCCGIAEVVKHGMIGDVELFDLLEVGSWKLGVGDWIERAIRVKVDLIERDPFEQGERAHLNLGHTFGHAIEKASDYGLKHGEAVAIGLVCATRLSANRRMCDASMGKRVEDLLRAVGLPTRIPHGLSVASILNAMATDKKRMDARLRFVLPRTIGHVEIVGDVSMDEVTAVIEELRNRKSEMAN